MSYQGKNEENPSSTLSVIVMKRGREDYTRVRAQGTEHRAGGSETHRGWGLDWGQDVRWREVRENAEEITRGVVMKGLGESC